MLATTDAYQGWAHGYSGDHVRETWGQGFDLLFVVADSLGNGARGFDSQETAPKHVTRQLLDNGGKTYITNKCGYTLVCSIDYKDFWITTGKDASKADFADKVIAPGGQDNDSYSIEPTRKGFSPQVLVTLRIQQAKQGNTVTIPADHSVVAISAS